MSNTPSERYLIIKKRVIYLKIRRSIPDAMHTGKNVIIEDILKPYGKERYSIVHKRRMFKKNKKEKDKILITQESYENIVLKLLRTKINDTNNDIEKLIEGDDKVLNNILLMRDDLMHDLIGLALILSIAANDRNNYYSFQLDKECPRDILRLCFNRIRSLIENSRQKEQLPEVEWT